jgi:cell division protein FtsQ
MNHRRSRPPRLRVRPKQINILHTSTSQKQTRRQMLQAIGWCGAVLVMIIAVGVALHFGISFVLDHVLYNNEHYTLAKIDIEPRGRFSERVIRQQAGLEPGENLWALNLAQITRDIEKLPYVSTARVERHFPDRVSIVIKERIPVVKIVGLNIDLNTRETFYLDRQCVVLKPRENESVPFLPEIVGLTDAELEPGATLERPSLARAMDILDAIDHSQLHTLIDIQTINLSDPLSIKMTTRQDMAINFRPDYIDQQLGRLLQIINYPDFAMRQIHSVDLTEDYNVPVTFSQIQ